MSALDAAGAAAMIRRASVCIDAAADELSRLDAVAGDGDHGVNMAAAFADADARVSAASPSTPAEVFLLAARSFTEVVGGSAGALFGTFFATLASTLGGDVAPTAGAFAAALGAATSRVAAVGRATTGDKTMLDALQPAADAASAATGSRSDLGAVLTAAAGAARAGAAATATMAARAGRARYATAGAVGTPDPGAVTVATMFDAWAEAVSIGGRP